MEKAEEIATKALNYAKELGLYNNYAYALGVLMAKYDLLFNEFEQFKGETKF